jgi:hypothetical protein
MNFKRLFPFLTAGLVLAGIAADKPSGSGVIHLDHDKVAFVNMNHGPLDSLIKSVLATLFPFLPAQTLIRLPVLFLLLTSVAVAWRILRQCGAGAKDEKTEPP